MARLKTRGEMGHEDLLKFVEGSRELGGWSAEAIVDQIMFELNNQRETKTSQVHWKLRSDPKVDCPPISTLNV
jgi:hypothetical protein